jgi:hypothetical protein
MLAAIASALGCADNAAGMGTPDGTGTVLPPNQTGGLPMAGAGGISSNPTKPGDVTTPINPGGATTGATGGSVGGAMPCDVEKVVKSGCQGCHGATPIGGAPMSLLSLADFQKDYTAKSTTQLKGQTMKK